MTDNQAKRLTLLKPSTKVRFEDGFESNDITDLKDLIDSPDIRYSDAYHSPDQRGQERSQSQSSRNKPDTRRASPSKSREPAGTGIGSPGYQFRPSGLDAFSGVASPEVARQSIGYRNSPPRASATGQIERRSIDHQGRVIREITHTVRHNPVMVSAVGDMNRWREAWEREKAMREVEMREFREKLMAVEQINKGMCRDWEERIKKMEAEKEQIRKDYNKMLMEAKHSSSKYDAKEKLLDNVSKANITLGDEIITMEDNMARANEKISQIGSYNRTLVDQLEEAKADIKSKSLEISLLQVEIEGLKSDNEQKSEKIKTMNYNTNEDATALKDAQQDIVNQKHEITKMKDWLASEARNKDEINKYCRELEDQIKQQSQRYTTERLDLQQSAEKAEKLEKEAIERYDKLVQCYENLLKEKGRLTEDLKVQSTLAESSMAAGNSARDELAKETERRKHAEKNLAEKENIAASTRSELNLTKQTTSCQISELNLKLDEEKAMNKVTIDSLRSEIADWKSRHRSIEVKFESKGNECIRLTDLVKTENRRVADLRNEKEQMQKKIEDLNQIKYSLTDKLHKDELNNGMMSKDIDMIRKETQLLKNEYFISQNHLLTERCRNKDLEQQLVEVKENLSKLQNKNSIDSDKTKKVIDDVYTLKADNKILREKYERKCKETECLYQEVQRCKDNMSKAVNEKLRFIHDVHRIEQESMLLRASIGHQDNTPFKPFAESDSQVKIERISGISPVLNK